MIDLGNASLAKLEALLHEWGCLWGIKDLQGRVSLRFSHRLRKSLGRCRPDQGTITLRAGLPMATLYAILCHEAAHVAAFLLYGAAVKPHGQEWASLVSTAGFTPAVRLPGPATNTPGSSVPPRPFRYAHQCLACQATRWARRPMRCWRCADCLALGLAGAMQVIDKQDPGVPTCR